MHKNILPCLQCFILKLLTAQHYCYLDDGLYTLLKNKKNKEKSDKFEFMLFIECIFPVIKAAHFSLPQIIHNKFQCYLKNCVKLHPTGIVQYEVEDFTSLKKGDGACA